MIESKTKPPTGTDRTELLRLLTHCQRERELLLAEVVRLDAQIGGRDRIISALLVELRPFRPDLFGEEVPDAVH